jgi:hypothetical protein
MKSCTIICSSNSGKGMSIKKQNDIEKLRSYLIEEKKMTTDIVLLSIQGTLQN